jgi:hypothetical protein
MKVKALGVLLHATVVSVKLRATAAIVTVVVVVVPQVAEEVGAASPTGRC